MEKVRRIFLMFVGSLSVVFGVIGIFVPGLPTTPFLLLSSWLFYKSSPYLHDALHRSRWLGPYIRRFQEKRGMNWQTKLVSLVCMWSMICVSAFVFIECWTVRWLLVCLGLVGSYCVLFVVPNPKKRI